MKRTLRVVLAAVMLLAAVTVASAAEIRDGARIALGSERFALYSLPSDGERQVTPGRQFENGLSAYYADVDGTSYWGLMDGACRVLLQPEYTGIFPLVKEERGGEEIQNLLVLMTTDQKLQLYNARTRELLPGKYDALTGQQTELQYGCRGDLELSENEQRNVVLGSMILLQSGELVGAADLDGNITVQMEYDSAYLVAPNRGVFKKDSVVNAWMYDTLGNMLTHDYASIGNFIEGRAYARKVADGWQTPVHYWIDEAGQMRIRWDDDEEGKGSLTIRSDFDGGLQSVKVFKDRKPTPYYMDANGSLHETDRARLREFVLDCANNRVLNADGRYVSAPGLTAELCSYRDDCQWIKIYSPTTGRYAVADRRTGMITPFRYDGVQMVSYGGEDYMIVQRDGKVGVLGEGCRQLVPEQYATVSAPDGKCAYFVARRNVNVGAYSVPRSTLWSLDGEMLGEEDALEDYFSSKAHTTGVAYGRLPGGHTVLIAPDGTMTKTGERSIITGDDDNWSPASTPFGVYGQNYETGEHGFIGLDGVLYPLYSETDAMQLKGLAQAEVTGGVMYVEYSAKDVTYYSKNCLLRDLQWTYHYEENEDAGTDITLISSSPKDGAVKVPERTDSVTLRFGCPIAVVNPDRITVTGEYDDPGFEVISAGNTVKLRLTDEFFEGDRYTVTFDTSALARTDQSRVYNTEPISISFTLDGLSTNDLMEKYPIALTQAQPIGTIFSGAAGSVDAMVQYYCGKYDEGKLLTSLFYASKNAWTLSAGEFTRLLSGLDVTKDTFVQEAADLLIGRMCLDYTLHETGAKAKAAADLIGIMKTLDYSGDLKATQQMLDAVKAYCEAYDIPWDMGLIRSAVEFFLTVSLPLLKESFKTTGNWGDIAQTTDLVGKYLITVLQYANMQTDAMKTMRDYLPPTGDLHWEIERRLDMIENGQIGMYLAREAQKLILKKTGGMLADAVKNAAGSAVTGQLGSYEALMEVMGAAYGRLTGRADAGKHVQVLLLACFAQEMTNAHAQVCQELLINGATEQEKQDLRTMYEAKRSAWCILLETAAKLRTDDDDTYHHDECLVWRDRIEQECGFADYIRAAKRAAPSQAVYGMRAPARRSSAQNTQYDVQYGVLKGYRFLDGAWEDGAAVLLDQKNTEAALYVTQELAGSVGENAFAGENGLRVVTLADGVDIEAGAFSNCENLTMLVLEGEHGINMQAFKKSRVKVVYGKTDTAQALAERLNAKYRDLSQQVKVLDYTGTVSAVQPGQTPDLSGITLRADGEAISLEDCCVLYPQGLGEGEIKIRYLDAEVCIPLTVSLRAELNGQTLEVTRAEESGDVLLLSGTATGDAVLAAVYDGMRLLDAQVCAVKDGTFSLTVRAGGTVCLFMTQDGCPLTPKLTVPAA